jgi:hypothetical protein
VFRKKMSQPASHGVDDNNGKAKVGSIISAYDLH